jgi:hypothetical protein
MFWKDEVAQNNGNILGYFLFKQIYYIFTKISSFKIWFVAGILRFQKWFDVDVFGCKLSFVVDILAFFDLKTFWATF